MSTDGWVDKENAVHAYNRILFLKIRKSEIDYSMDESQGHYINTKWKKSVPERQILYDSPLYELF